MTSTTPRSFYDDLAPSYHLLYADWEGSVVRQGAALAALLHEFGVPRGARVLDVACGIGTQTIGLAENGYTLSASDLSHAAVERARAELTKRGLTAVLAVADMRALPVTDAAPFDAVIARDNAVPHLLTDAEILAAFKSCHAVMRPGGVLVISVRDYATVARRASQVLPYGVRREGDRRALAVQVWEWDGDRYDVRLYITEDRDGTCTTHVHRSRYYAIPIHRLLELMGEAGFVTTHRRDGVLFQPVLIGVRGMG
jgi:SAM-dependent methyltransferase